MEFADEVIKRDLPDIQGKSNEQILSYYNNKVQGFENAADDFLSGVKEKVDRKELINLVNQATSSREGRVLQGATKTQLQNLQDEVATLPDKVDLVTANQIKRDIQTAARSFYTAKGEPSPQSEALAEVASRVRRLIEGKAPGIKEVNSSVSFYHTAQEAIQRRLDALARSEGGLVPQMLSGAGIGGAGASLAFGRPELAAAAGLPALMNVLYRTPQFKTKAAAAGVSVAQKQMPDILKRLLLISGGRVGASF